MITNHILCSQLIRHFLENCKFYFWVHVTPGLLNVNEVVFLVEDGEIFIKSK